MIRKPLEVVVAGHICLDVIPAIESKKEGLSAMLVPGALVDVGQAVIATGGTVSNTGLALHRLGTGVKLIGKVGRDLFGDAVLTYLRNHGEHLTEGMIMSEAAATSYTIVISPPNVDRIFLHCTGANDTFTSADIQEDELLGAKLFHFGYPPLMRSIFAHGGRELEELLKKVKRAGLTVSLDLAKPDPESEAGKANWRDILRRVLPYTDVFLPSFEEILFMLNRKQYEQLIAKAPKGTSIIDFVNGEMLSSISEELLDMGAAVAGLKLGEHGMYVRTSKDAARFEAMGAAAPSGDRECWRDQEWLCPAFEVKVAGTTGAGDCSIAGFLRGLLDGMSLEDTLIGAVAVGACNVEQSDAASGIIPMEQVRQRIRNGWPIRKTKLALSGWTRKSAGLYHKVTV